MGRVGLLRHAAMSWGKMNLRLLFVLSLAGCATSPNYEEHAQTMATYRLDPVTRSKVNQGQRLELADIVRLSLKGIPDETLLAYLKRQGAVYALYPHDVGFLRNYEVNEPIIDYLVSTPQRQARFKGKGYVPPNVCRPYYSRAFGTK